MGFKDKVIWITGASSGIGEHLTYALADEGARLILSSRNEKELQRVKDNCQNDCNILILPLDITDFEAMQPAVHKAVEAFGKIDLLINNAGLSQRSLIKETMLAVDRRIMEVNYLGTVAMTKAVLPVMLAQGHGHIAVVSSVMGIIGVPWRSAYAASKHALHGYFDSMRSEMFRDNIKVTILCPGYVRTNVTINALRGDGSRNNQMAEETSKGMDPTFCARKMLRAIEREREETYIGGWELSAIYVKRFTPWLFSYVVKRLRFSAQGMRRR
ncbi:MAG TPA: SDR family oxidoreductase [Saprospiraceae bacterium]|nr:SDR family oxidoreductase [Saprospiraceae bacterium]HMP23196.1 SDR family oxidoreductase [Saprospiraceae bacterium]